jgi:acyl-CoA thioesterase
MSTRPDAQAVAEAVARTFAERDRLIAKFGIDIVVVAPGRTTLRMTVRDDMLNALDTCHGGTMFALADVAFGLCCNSHNQNMVAMTCSISYLKGVHAGDVLTASAREAMREGRNGIYDITLTDQDGHTVAEFRGHSRSVPGHLVPDLAEGKET